MLSLWAMRDPPDFVQSPELMRFRYYVTTVSFVCVSLDIFLFVSLVPRSHLVSSLPMSGNIPFRRVYNCLDHFPAWRGDGVCWCHWCYNYYFYFARCCVLQDAPLGYWPGLEACGGGCPLHHWLYYHAFLRGNDIRVRVDCGTRNSELPAQGASFVLGSLEHFVYVHQCRP